MRARINRLTLPHFIDLNLFIFDLLPYSLLQTYHFNLTYQLIDHLRLVFYLGSQNSRYLRL